MQVKASWLKPAVWGVIIGAVGMMILGFSWMGWVLGGTAERMAAERANTAVVRALTPFCVASFMQEPDAAAKLKELQATSSWMQQEFIVAGGWATSAVDTSPNSGVASACAEQLMKAKL
jgi:hypothetical protein